MELGCLIVCCCLLSQQSPPRSGVGAFREQPPAAGPLVNIERKPKLTPPRLIAESLTAPAEDPLPGRPLSLLDVLTRAGTRPRQLAALQSYWTLSAAVGEYYCCRQELETLAALSTAATRSRQQADKVESSALAAELALASARVKEAELRAVAAQAELADRLGLPQTDRTPLPADEPNGRRYITHFDVLFASRAAPPRLQLLERTLALRFKAIEVRAEAVQAAGDALDAAQESLKQREIYAEHVAERVVHLGRQRKAFWEAVRLYNHDIAEYALAVADPNFTPASLQPMLIRPKPTPTPPATERQNSAESSAAEVESPRTTRLPPGMRSLLRSNSAQDEGETRLKPSAEGDQLAQATPAEPGAADYQSYDALLELSRPKRTHRLARLLHWDRSSADGAEPSLTLEQCLATVSPADRRRAVEVYWTAREQAARCQVFADQIDQLAALEPATLHAVRRPGGREAMVDLRAHQLAAAADLSDNQALLWSRRLELATLVGKATAKKDWPMPATPPHGGRYETRLELQPQTLATSPTVQGLATLVLGLYAALEDRADAIVRLDSQRAAAVEVFEPAQQHVDLSEPLKLVARQSSESLAFLSTLTRYNLSIADYALAILPASTSPLDLAPYLIVQAK